MNISINWLKEYVDLSGLSVKEISDGLTLAGLEAEGFTELKAVNNVVTAKVLSKTKHPDADKLNVCVVTDGSNEYQVVCGAPNVEAGQTVAFAKIGAVLGDLKIKEAKLRGVESFGMICSERELGLTDEHNGIMVLPEGTALGEDINKITGLGDTVVEFNATPNRPDWLSVIGTAREAAAVFGRKLNLPEVKEHTGSEKIDGLISVDVLEKGDCPIYTAKVIKGIKIGPSPLWMQAKLRSAGVRPINNIVDVTNYILMEWGQPLHAFDIRNIDKGIVVRRAENGEKITALDGKDYTLDSSMLVIADKSKLLAVAGIMGGEHTSVMADTETIVLECAYFEPSLIRKASKKLGLSSDSSYRYERGIDYGLTEQLSSYAANMVAEICGGYVLEGTAGGSYIEKTVKTVSSSAEKINKLLGTDFSVKDMQNALNNLSIPTKVDGDMLISEIPTFRGDINHYTDIAEEVARIMGYDKIGYTMPHLDSDLSVHSPLIRYPRIFRNRLETLGFSEVVNFSFLGQEYLQLFHENEEDYVKLLNPISVDMAWMRTYLFPSVLKNIQTNRNQGFKTIKLFEISNTYKSKGKKNLAEEKLHLSLGMLGSFYGDTWIKTPNIEGYYYLKGIVDNILSITGLEIKYRRLDDVKFLHPGKSAGVYVNGEYAGFIGVLHPDYAEKLDIKEECLIAELDLSYIIEQSVNKNEKQKTSMVYRKVSRYPSVERDLSFIVKSDLEADILLSRLKEINGLITEVSIFDVFEGKPISLGYKNIGLRITFTHQEKTLRDEDINPIIEEILDVFKNEYGAVLR